MDNNEFMPDLEKVKLEMSLNKNEMERTTTREVKEMDKISPNTDEVDKYLNDQMKRKWGLLSKIANPTMHRAIQSIKTDLMEVSAEARIAAYKTITNTRLNVLQERCNASAKMIKGSLRQEYISFILHKQQLLREDITNRQYLFFENMKGKYAYLETLKSYKSMYERFSKTIFREEESYLQFLDSLVMKFESLIDEEIQNY